MRDNAIICKYFKGDTTVRTMVYRLKLDNSNGESFVISNTGDADQADLSVMSDAVWAPAIRMTLLDLPDESDPEAEKFVNVPSRRDYLDQFEFTEDNWLNPEFRACYERAICGEDTGWKLAKVSIHENRLSLLFVSTERYCNIQGRNDQDDDPGYYEVVDFRPNELAEGGVFCFEVARPDGLSESYRVSISCSLTNVKESIGNQIRNIRFDKKTDDGQWVTITWCC